MRELLPDDLNCPHQERTVHIQAVKGAGAESRNTFKPTISDAIGVAGRFISHHRIGISFSELEATHVQDMAHATGRALLKMIHTKIV